MVPVSSENTYKPHIQAPLASVLVVDDNTVNINAAKGLLSIFKIKADGALSGAEAVKKVGEKQYDLILLDYMMPEMDGAETAKTLRNMGFTAESMPIVSISSDVSEASVRIYLESGMQDALEKPIDAALLGSILEKWLDKSKIVDFETTRKKNAEMLEMLKALDEIDSDAVTRKADESFEELEKFLALYVKNIPPMLQVLPQKVGDGTKLAAMLNRVCIILENVCAKNLDFEALQIESKAAQNQTDECKTMISGFTARLNALYSGISGILNTKNS